MTSPVQFQNMPPLSPDEYAGLTASIREHGIQVPIHVDEHGIVIDGHHRQKIAAELGINCPKTVVIGKTHTEKRTLALTLNADRRHLSREQRRALIAESVKADPQLSDREHARRTGASPTTVGTVREELESSGEVSKLDTRVGADGVHQPTAKPSAPSAPSPDDPMAGWSTSASDAFVKVAETTKTETYIDTTTGEVMPPPKPEASKSRRRPITDQARDAGLDIRKTTERIQRITNDDRYAPNKEQVTAHLRGHLMFAIDALQDVLDRLSTN